MADETLIIDDRSSGKLESTSGNSWRLITDVVMGGLSSGELSLATIDDKACLRLQGDVSLANNGGFIQAALDIGNTAAADASSYSGLFLEVYGNDQDYNVHLRTDDVWLPWQSYRASFRAPARWQTVRLPFDQFTGYRIGKELDLKHLKRIGLVAIGHAFAADLCVAKIGLYRD
ncbi:MAG: CIA30 family protein [Gammaproteobacteria bacterium]|nr:CIA30 family protein [Gammaproteobacteria bacterium]